MAKPERVHSVCPHDCPSTCALEVERLDGRTIGRVYGARGNDYTDGVICAKVAAYAERVHHPDRLTHPLRRVGAKGIGLDAFQRISWDEALDETAGRFAEAARRHGSESVWPYFYAGTMGLLQRDGIDRLRHAMGYSRQRETICNMLTNSGWRAGAGVKRGIDGREIAETDLLVVWGGNPVNTQVNVMHHFARARRERGAKLVVVDPYRTDTAANADLHLMLRPGTDAALACAVMHVLFRDGHADRDYLARYTDCPDDLEKHLASRDPAWACAITAVPVEDIEAFARMYGETKRSFLRLGYGFSRSRNGAVSMHAASCLPAVTGAWRHRGGGALYSNSALAGIDFTLIMGLDVRDRSVRMLDMSRIGPVLCGEPADIGDGPPITAMLIQNTNPMSVAPDSGAVRRGMSRDDLFLCVHEQFMTETAAMADIVLPATTFLEHDDIYVSSGHTFVQLARAVIDAPGECRSNHEVICALAARLGASHRGFSMSAWEIIDETLRRSGLPDAETLAERHWHDVSRGFDEMHFLNGFGHDDGRFHFRADWSRGLHYRSDMPALPDHYAVIDADSERCPFRLVTAPARWFLNSSFSETANSRRRQGRPTAKLHPDDCAALGVAAGDAVRIGNDRGSLLVAAEPFAGVHRGTVIVESIWPARCFAEGRGVNTLTSADPGLPDGGAVFHDTAVWVRGEPWPAVADSDSVPA